MLVLVHLDALIIIGRVLYDVNLLRLSELGDFIFSLHFVCASYERELYIMPSLQWYLSCIFVIYVVTSTSMQSLSLLYFVAMLPCCYHALYA